EKELLRAGAAALDRLECQALAVTRGRHGLALFTRDGHTLIARHGSEAAVDVTGAGDTVGAALALALAAGGSALDAARLANIAGALVVMKPGTATVSLKELQGELRPVPSPDGRESRR